DVLRAPPREVAGELAERPLGLAYTGEDLSFDHDLGHGGGGEGDGGGGRPGPRLARQPPRPPEIARGRGRGRTGGPADRGGGTGGEGSACRWVYGGGGYWNMRGRECRLTPIRFLPLSWKRW